MKFERPAASVNFPELEKTVLDFWKKNEVFERSVSERPQEKTWSFYDGPPFATGLPHHGHILAGTIKDVVPRYWTMRGYRVERRFGWDCHGLPVEFEMEKELDLKGRQDILNYGVDKFNEACRGIVLRYTNEWRETVERMGRWIDFDRDYKTMDLDFMESVWAVFKKLWDRGLVYEDKKVLPYSTRIATPLSNFEANLNYQDVQDPSITVKVRLKNEKDTFLLIWTTTPWTLPANLAVAVHPDMPYVKIQDEKTKEKYYVHEKLAATLYKSKSKDKKYKVLEKLHGKDLEGLSYDQIIPAFEGKVPSQAHQVRLGEFVTDDSGTGLVHVAGAFGEDDYQLCKEAGLDPLDHLDEQGVFTHHCSLFEGEYFKDADKKIIQYLKDQGTLFHQDTIQHSYPFCYRSDTPLIYRAISTWFVRVTSIKDKLLTNNQQIHWVPEHLQEGRFGKWLEGARDWAISRNRFWGNPIPIWRDEESGEAICIGSRRELEELSGQKVNDLHKHFVDSLTIESKSTGKKLARIPHVLDCWFESGSMPYAQNHYPFSVSEAEFDKIFPADFIAEGLDQTRGWFYTLLVLSTALDKGPPFKNVVVNGIVLGEDGRKMSKRLKNYPKPDEVFDNYGADTLRIYLLQSGAVRGEDLRFSRENLKEMTRKVLLPIWNAYSFLATYASVDGWDPSSEFSADRNHDLDRWISVKLEKLKKRIEEEMERYHLSKTVPPLLEFIDDLTNWYIRRSRRRFWKSENDQDKKEAYSTLYEVLCDFTKLAAPFIPFLTDAVFQKLRLGHSLAASDSVHLEDYPRPRALSDKDIELESAMDNTRNIVALGRELREKLKIRIRQPLSTLYIGTIDSTLEDKLTKLLPVIREELNVHDIRFTKFEDMAEWAVKPNFRLLGQKLGPKIKEFQKSVKSLSDESVSKLVSGQKIKVANEEYDQSAFLIDLNAKETFHHPCHSAGSIVIALDKNITPELQNEGFSRELINRVQRFRKEIDLNVEDRIFLHVEAKGDLANAFQSFSELIENETLSKLELKAPTSKMKSQEETIDGHSVTFGIVRQ